MKRKHDVRTISERPSVYIHRNRTGRSTHLPVPVLLLSEDNERTRNWSVECESGPGRNMILGISPAKGLASS